jgi:hypothetical protein
MKNLFIINEEEKNRILNLHETATKRQYLSEQSLDLGQSDEPTQPVTTVPTLLDSGAMVKQGIPPDPYVYAKLGNDYYYSKDVDSDNPNWTLAKKEKSIKAIKGKIFNEKIPVKKNVTPPKKGKTKVQNPKKKTDKVDDKKVVDKTKVNKVVLSPYINPKFKSMIDVSKLSTTSPVKIFSALPNKDCAQFVNDFDDSRAKILNAWTAHDVPSVGNTIFSSFTNLNSDQIDKVTDLWKDINSDSKGKGNTYSSEVMKLVNSIVPKSSGVSLKLNDVVGLFYPGSKHHEEAFYSAGKRFFRKNMLGMTVNGDTIKKGIGWGMNTHVGIVGAIDNGVPIIFHNIGGQVWADPYNNLKGGSRIAWIKRA